MASTQTRKMVLAAIAACDDKKGEDTRVLQLDPADSAFTDFFVITSAANERQAQAIADEIELRLKREFGTYANSVEGRRVGEWILLDYVDFVVHIFLRAPRVLRHRAPAQNGPPHRARRTDRRADGENARRAKEGARETGRGEEAGGEKGPC